MIITKKMRNKILCYFIFSQLVIFITGCSLLNYSISDKKIGNKNWKEKESIDFLVVGDWGRNGKFHQKDVAEQMGKNADSINCDFVISTGDNFYVNGVRSIRDRKWKKSFEKIYTANSLQIPWFVCFGNHDYQGRINAQLKYGRKSQRWKTEKRYYSFDKEIPNSEEKVLFIFIDTNPFDGTLIRKKHSDLAKQDTLLQKKWLIETLNSSNCKWKIIIGHHPLFTTGTRRGQMIDVRQSFLSVFEKYQVDAYFAGHEHDLQHQKPKGFTHYFVSGAGSEIRSVSYDSLQTKFAVSDHGFMNVELKKDALNVTVINYLGKDLYKTSIKK